MHRSLAVGARALLTVCTFSLFVFAGQTVGDVAIERHWTPFETARAYAAESGGDAKQDTPKPAARRAAASDDFKVQAVLSPRKRAVIASAIDGKIIKMPVENGDTFEKGDVLIEYDCGMDYGRLKETRARQKSSEVQLAAYEKLRKLESASNIELEMSRQEYEQIKAQVEQMQSRIKYCKVTAPFDGRVTNKMASLHEYVQTGRVLMDISSNDALRAEFLIPSRWLQWLNVGTQAQVHINESDSDYSARIVSIHGQVDPVSQTVQVVAEMENYHEELLPGMSGMATFDPSAASSGIEKGFLGLNLGQDGAGGDERPK